MSLNKNNVSIKNNTKILNVVTLSKSIALLISIFTDTLFSRLQRLHLRITQIHQTFPIK